MPSTTLPAAPTAVATAPAPARPVFHPGVGQWVSKAVDQAWFTAPVMQREHPAWSTPDEGAALLARDGYLVIPELFSADESDRLLHRLVHEGGDDAQYDVKGWCFNKTIDLDYQRSSTWLWALDKERGIEQLDRLLGSDCRLMHGGLWATGPGRKMGLHIDHRAMHLPDGMELPSPLVMPCYLAVLIAALEDQTPEMGPTMVVPGSHRWNPCAARAPMTPVALLLRKGEGLLLRGDLCHGAAPNTGPRRRHHFHSTWGNAFIEPFLPPLRYASYWDPRIAAEATPRQRRILGGWGHPNGGRERIWADAHGIDPATLGLPGYG